MQSVSKGLMVRLFITSYVFFSIMGCFIGYISAYALNGKEFSAQIVGYIMAAYAGMAFAGQIFWTSFCDRVKTNKKVFMAVMAAALAVYFLVFYAASPVMFIICYGLFGFMYQPMKSVLESWTLKILHGDTGLYGKIRSSGALGYGIGMLIEGFIIRRVGYSVMLVAAVSFTLLLLVLVCTIPDASYSKAELGKGGMKLKDIGKILKNPVILLLMGIMLTIGLTTNPVSNFKIMIMEKVGGGTDYLGIESATGCFVQFLMYLTVSFFNRFSARNVMIGVAASFLLSVVIYGTTTSFGVILFGSFFLFGTFALLQTSMMRIVTEYVNPDLQTTGIGVVDTCFTSIAGIIAMLFYGNLIDAHGLSFVVRICWTTGTISVVLSIVLALLKKKR